MKELKGYTDLEQSKKLVEILPLESADLYYDIGFDNEYHIQMPTNGYFGNKRFFIQFPEAVPCWSLAALLSVLPLGIYDEFDNCDYELEIDIIDKMPRYIRLGDIYHSQFPYDFEKDTLLDNVVASIIWLHDNNYFEL